MIAPQTSWLRTSRRGAGAGTLCLLALLACGLGARREAGAHAGWPTYYSLKSTVQASAAGLEAAVTIEVPTVLLVPKFRRHFRDLDLKEEIEAGRFEALEEQFKQHQFATFAAGLSFSLDGHGVAGQWQPLDTPVNGRATEGFFVYLLRFVPDEPIDPGSRAEAVIRNELFAGDNLVMAGIVEVADGWQTLEVSAPQPPPGTDLTTGSAAEMALWSGDESMRTFRVVLARAAPSAASR